MNGTRPHPLSLRERMRLITTGACVLMALLGLWSLLGARPVHGALALVGSALLVQGSIWGRKAKRTPLRHR